MIKCNNSSLTITSKDQKNLYEIKKLHQLADVKLSSSSALGLSYFPAYKHPDWPTRSGRALPQAEPSSVALSIDITSSIQ